MATEPNHNPYSPPQAGGVDAGMRLPQRADKWIVLVLMTGAGVAYMWRLAGIDPLGWVGIVAIALLSGAALTVCYVVWCAAWRLLAAFFFAGRAKPGRIRALANVSFLLVFGVLAFAPGKTGVITVELPRPVKIHLPATPGPDRPSHPGD
jgi:hypothetical protein